MSESENFNHIPSAIIVLRSFDTKNILYKVDSPNRDGVMVMCNGNALQCITIFKVMGSNV